MLPPPRAAFSFPASSVEGQQKIMASTQFEALDARRCLPCWDEPDVKASFECTLTLLQSHLTGISNMPETEVTYLPGGKKRIRFAESPKMSTCVACGAGVAFVLRCAARLPCSTICVDLRTSTVRACVRCVRACVVELSV
jgi:hypothetical protein